MTARVITAYRQRDGTVEAEPDLCCYHAMGDPPGECCLGCSNCSMYEPSEVRT